jgi:gamma-glutamyltranspeptidase/glutathione hydrolase
MNPRLISAATLLLLFVADIRAQIPSDAPGAKREPSITLLSDSDEHRAEGTNGAVVAGGKAATAAGIEIMKKGGNAADAAAATILALSVTDSKLFCFGGEVPILYRDGMTKTVEVICGQGVAPGLATRAYFAKKGGIPNKGIEAAAVPGALDAVVTLLIRHGSKTFGFVAAPTLRLLEKHAEPWHADLERTLIRLIAAEALAGFGRETGLKGVSDYFYRGPIAREIDAWSKENGGLIRYSDMATHLTRIESPVSKIFHGFQIFKCGAWSQGPALLEALDIVECFSMNFSLTRPNGPHTIPRGPVESADLVHFSVEALKLALADRDAYYADPLFVEVPLEQLLSREYARARAKLIDLDHASLVQRPGDPLHGKALLDEQRAKILLRSGKYAASNDTTTCLTADKEGNVVAATPSGWSGVVAGKTGVWLGSRLQSFNIWEGHPNCIEPGKRPRITLSPTIATNESGKALAISVAGGDNQDQVTFQLIINSLILGMDADESVRSQRFLTDHMVGSFSQTQPKLGSLKLYESFDPKIVAALKAKGHVVTLHKPPMAAAPTMLRIELRANTSIIEAAGDPAARRHAAAY